MNTIVSFENHNETMIALKQKQEKINHNKTLGYSQRNQQKLVKLQRENPGIAGIFIQSSKTKRL